MSFQKMPFLARCAWLTLAFVHTAYASSCYYPGGGLATDFDYVPCTGSKFSSCCIPSEGDVCLSNGLCYWNDAPYVFRGACTDPTWKSSDCSKWCAAGDPDTYNILTSCGGTKYCCSSGGSSCCQEPNLVFDIGTPSVINKYSATSSVVVPNGLITASAGAASSSASASGTPSSTPSAASNSGVGKGTIIGIAVGVITFIVLVGAAVLAWFCVYKRKGKNITPTPNLIDMNNPTVGDNASVTALYQGPKADMYPSSPMSAWEAAPPYNQSQHGHYAAPYQQQIKGPEGQEVFELQSPLAKPTRQHVHELG